MGASHRGKKRSPEAVAKLAAVHRGLKRSPETRAKMRAASAKRDRASWAKAPETRARMSEYAKHRTPEHQAKITAGIRRARERKKAASGGGE